MNKGRSFAIIGCQHLHIGEFIEEMLQLGYTCTGIYDSNPTKVCKTIMERFGIPLASSAEQLLHSDIDVVGCASINNEKIDVVELCEQHNKHIMLDKPIVTNRYGYERLQAVIERGNIQVGLKFGYYFSSAAYTLKEQIDQGVLGKIVHIGMREPHRLSKEKRPDWHFSKEQSGGIIIDLLIHDFSFLRWLTGKEIVAMDGYMAKNMLPEHPSFYDATMFQVQMEDNIMVQLYADWHTAEQSWTWGDERIFVAGTKGSAEIRLNGDPLVTKDSEDSLLIRITDQEAIQQIPLRELPVTATEDFLNRINGQPSIVTHADILIASRASIEADEQARIIRR